MKKANIIAAAAVATAGIATYLVRKRIRSRKEERTGQLPTAESGQHIREIFAKAKSSAK